VCVYSLNYPASQAHAPYYIVILGLSGYTTFVPHYLKLHDFQKEKVIEHKMYVLIFYATFVCNTSHSKKNSAIYGH
jgi:hypothetical protein